MGGAPSRTFKRRKHLSLGFHYFLVTGKKISLFWVKVHESSLLGTHERWCAGWMGVQRLPESNSHSGTAGAAERESSRSPAPCDSAWGWGGRDKVPTELHLPHQEAMLRVSRGLGPGAESQNSCQGTCVFPAWPACAHAGPVQHLSPALVRTTVLFCNNMSSLSICLLSTAFPPAIHYH